VFHNRAIEWRHLLQVVTERHVVLSGVLRRLGEDTDFSLTPVLSRRKVIGEPRGWELFS
jgi:hypothetical protein